MSRVLFRSSVFVIVRDEAGRVLLHRRKNTGYLDEHYDFPSGHVEDGESFSEAAMRELAEEVGLQTHETDLQIIHLYQNYAGTPYINVVYNALEWEGTPAILEPTKCDDLQFFPIDVLPQKCTLTVRLIERAGFDAAFNTSRVTPDDSESLLGIS